MVLISEKTRIAIEEKISLDNTTQDDLNYISSDTKVRLTKEGGVGILMTNKTGAASVKGSVVSLHSGFVNAVKLVEVDTPDPMGVIYEDGVADGEEVIVVFSGITKVLFVGSTTIGHFARNCMSTDSGATAGQAIDEAYPSAPFATDKHFMEIGHICESRVGAGLANVILHFN